MVAARSKGPFSFLWQLIRFLQTIMWQLKRPGTLCYNDAKSCYDLIGHAQASLAMQRQGVSQSVADCLFFMLQNATH
jgi:hypothetical protein